MTIRGTKRKRIGPIVVNMASAGFLRWHITSWGVHVGPWSWNAKSGRHTLDIPGPWRWTSKGHRR